MSWIKITMKFDGKCIVCNQKVKAKEIGLWSKGIGVKHEKCAEQSFEIKCIICDGQAGCQTCEFLEDCDLQKISQSCICKKCEDSSDLFSTYQNSVIKKFPILRIQEEFQ
tara:strand:+ start:3883 stop:4212 length:330 start_codon:yes stop_codon:yes gene_type:complete